MRITGYGNYDFEADGYWCSIPAGYVPIAGINPTIINRTGTTATFGPGYISEQVIPAEFGYTGNLTYETAWLNLFNKLRPTDTAPRQLRAIRNDGTRVVIDAVMSVPSGATSNSDISTVPVTFISTSAVWTAVSQSSVSKTFASAVDQAITVPVTGYERTPLTLRIKPTGQRTAKTANVGWQYRVVYRVTNNSSETLVDYPYALDLGTTTGLVSGGKALSSGNDVRIVNDGIELPRVLVDWNSASFVTLAWIIIPLLPAGQYEDFEVWYGNASAGSPTTLTGIDRPAFDTSTAGANRSTNSSWRYRVNTTVSTDAGFGGWYVDSGSEQPAIRSFASPGAWRPARTLVASDSSIQPSYSTYTVSTTTYYTARFDAQRARNGVSLAGADGVNYDGVALTNAAGITSVSYDLSVINTTTSNSDASVIGQVVLLTRNSTGDDWRVSQITSALAATETTVGPNSPTFSPKRTSIAFAVWPADATRIDDSAGAASRIAAKWRSSLVVGIDGSVLPQSTVQTEEGIYELASQIRYGGDANLTPPYTAIRIGYTSSGSAITTRFGVRLNESVVVDVPNRTASVWNSTLTAKVSDVPYATLTAVDGVTSRDATVERASTGWIELRQYVDPLTNPSFDADATGWTRASATAGMTAAALTRTTAQFSSTPASASVVVSANTGGVGSAAVDYAALLPVNARTAITVAADVRCSNANLIGLPSVYWYDASGNYLSATTAADWTPVINTWYRRTLAATVPATATQYRVALVTKSVTSNQTGTVWFDTVTTNGNELVYSDVSIGTVAVDAAWTATYL